MTAGTSSLDWKRPISCSTTVDSALPGSQATASFFCAPVSLLAGRKASASTITQKARISHFEIRPETNRANLDIRYLGGRRGRFRQRFRCEVRGSIP